MPGQTAGHQRDLPSATTPDLLQPVPWYGTVPQCGTVWQSQYRSCSST